MPTPAEVAVPRQPAPPLPTAPTATRSTGLVVHERFFWHDTPGWVGASPSGIRSEAGMYNQPGKHFENADTKRRIYSLIAACGLLDSLTVLSPRMATVEEVARVHTTPYIAGIKDDSDRNGGDAGECAAFGTGSFEIALLAAGAGLTAVDSVMNGRLDNAYVLCRPPGHHAEADRGRGFCIFNNIAIAAKYAKEMHGLRRVACVDYDVHHGNGTEQAFYDDDSVLFVSIHQDRLYPQETGSAKSQGEGPGLGFNINLPMPPGTGVGGYKAAFERVVLPALKAFDPELVLVSSGFDASALDPLSHMMLPSSCFGEIAAMLIDAAAEGCAQGRVVFFHEGGYSEIIAPFCGLRVIEAIAGVEKSNVVDEYDEEIYHYGYQSLQPHQEAVIKEGEDSIALLTRNMAIMKQ